MSRPRTLGLRRATLAVAVVVAVLGATVAVRALSARDSRQITQDTSGVVGAGEVGDFAAESVVIGDFDDDGHGDVVVGAPHEDIGSVSDAGQIHVLYGSRRGVSTRGDRVFHQGTRGMADDPEADDLFGSALAVGDFDRDGHDDLAVGVPGEDIAGMADAGSIVVIYGGDRGLTLRSQGFSQDLGGEDAAIQPREYFGQALAAGDFDGDGYDDLAVGAPGDRSSGASGAGAVDVLYGSAAGLAAREGARFDQDAEGVRDGAEPDDAFGWAVTAGDFDGDGYDELAVGVPGETVGSQPGAGAVAVFAGSAEGVVAEGNMLFAEGTGGLAGRAEADDRFGTSLASADFDGDARADLAIGVPGQTRGRKFASGVLQVIPGSPEGLDPSAAKRINQASPRVPNSPDAGDELGYAVAAGDFNGFGRDDLAVGVPGESLGSAIGTGVVHVFFGGRDGLRTDNSQLWQPGQNGMAGSAQPNAGTGRALAAGDIDGDGLDDLVIAAPGRSVGSKAAAGAILVLLS